MFPENIMALRKDRVELRASARAPLQGARKIGPADPNQRIEVTIVVRRGSSQKEFHSAVERATSPLAERKYLTREQFATLHGARAGDCEAVRLFASEYGLEAVSEDRARRSILLSGTIASVSQAFGVELNDYLHLDRTCRCRTGTIQIPTDLEDVIEGVFGLDSRPQARAHFRRRIRTTPSDISYTVLQVAQAYRFPAGTNGGGQAIGVVELGGGYQSADLNSYFQNLGLATPSVSAISVDNATNSPTGSADGPDGEVELDIEVAGAIAPGAEIGVYFAPNTDQGFLDAVTTAIHDRTLRPSIVSVSWGGPEDSWTQQARNALNSAFQDAATMGVTVLAASGDSGATDGSSSGNLTVDFPASSPYVVGCGGTKLLLAGGTISGEQVWNELSQNEGASGGGISEVFQVPAFQSSADVPPAPNGFRGRGVPDVSGDADPATGYQVLVDGHTTVIGGTSAVAPLWAGLIARINQSLGKPVGYVNPLLYLANAANTFHAITSGNNGGYSAGPGWNPCTGLGTPNGSALLSALKDEEAR
jgi:kumamolisin